MSLTLWVAEARPDGYEVVRQRADPGAGDAGTRRVMAVMYSPVEARGYVGDGEPGGWEPVSVAWWPGEGQRVDLMREVRAGFVTAWSVVQQEVGGGFQVYEHRLPLGGAARVVVGAQCHLPERRGPDGSQVIEVYL